MFYIKPFLKHLRETQLYWDRIINMNTSKILSLKTKIMYPLSYNRLPDSMYLTEKVLNCVKTIQEILAFIRNRYAYIIPTHSYT